MSDLEAKWAERDRQREAFEARMAQEKAAHRARLVGVIADALASCDAEIELLSATAEVVYDALVADGVIFARMSTEDFDVL